MFNSIFGRLFTTTVLVILVALLLAVSLSAYLVRVEYLDDTSVDMEAYRADLNDAYLDSGMPSISNINFFQYILQFAYEKDILVVIFDQSGGIWWFSPANIAEDVMISPEDRDFNNLRIQALAGHKISKIFGQDNIMDVPVVSYAAPLTDENGQNIGAVAMFEKMGDLAILFSSINKQFMISAVVSFIVAFMLILAIARSITKPINEVTRSVKSLAKGDYSTRVEYKGEDEISYLANSFNDMARDLENHEALRNSFVGNVSHELRTPLTSITGFIQGVMDGTVPKEEQDKYLGVALSETKRLNALITDLMELSKVDSGKFPIRLTAFDINELMRITLLSFEKRIDEKHLDVHVDFEAENIYVAADKDKITQVVTNLIDNAIKFNEDKGVLRIATILRKNKVIARVTNTGKPIDKKDKKFIFERFYKADQSHNRGIPGTGIGLSLVKKILVQHGERIWIEDTPRETTFAFTLESARTLKSQPVDSSLEEK
ncbi:MAG: ATP-binding protein [Eubacteriales bacterium]